MINAQKAMQKEILLHLVIPLCAHYCTVPAEHFDVNNGDIKIALNNMRRYAPSIFEAGFATDEALVIMVAVEQKMRIPYLRFLVCDNLCSSYCELPESIFVLLLGGYVFTRTCAPSLRESPRRIYLQRLQ